MILSNLFHRRPHSFIDSSLRPPIYFMHITKTGGRSLRSFLRDQYRAEDYCDMAWPEFCLKPPEELRKFRLLHGHPLPRLKEFGLDDYRTVTFLRDPVKRAISSLRSMMRDPLYQGHGEVKGRSLRDLIYDDALMARITQTQLACLCFDLPLSEIIPFVRNRKAEGRTPHLNELTWEKSLEKASRILATFDFVGFTDRYEESVLGLCKQFDLSPMAIMPGQNRARDLEKNNGSDPIKALSERDIEHIKELSRDEIALYEGAVARWQAKTSREALHRALIEKKIYRWVSGPLDLDLGHPFSGGGWHQPETHNGHTVRWSSRPRAEITLPLIRNRPRHVKVSMRKPAHTPGIDVYLDDARVGTKITTSNGNMHLHFTIPAKTTDNGDPFTIIAFDCHAVTRFWERGDNDVRALGMLLNRLQIA